MKKWCAIGIAILYLVAVYIVFSFYATMPAFSGYLLEDGTTEKENPATSTYTFLKAGTYYISVAMNQCTATECTVRFYDAFGVDENNNEPIVYLEQDIEIRDYAYESILLDVPKDAKGFTVSISCPEGTVNNIFIDAALSRKYMDAYYVSALLIGLGCIVGIYYVRRKRIQQALSTDETLLPLEVTAALLLLITVAASWPFMTNYIMSGHDIDFHLTRIDGIAEGLQNGQFPVRMDYVAANIGYATPMVYPGLLLYFPALLRLVGVSMATSYGSYILLVTLLTAIFAYDAMKRISRSQFTSIAFAALYTMGYYRLCCIGVRSAVGEYTAMTFLPLVAAGVYELIYCEKCHIGRFIVGITGLLQSHVLSTVMAAALCALYLALHIRSLCNRKKLRTILRVGVISLLLNLWMLIPMLTTMRYGIAAASEEAVTVSTFTYQIAGSYLPQLFSSFSDPGGWATPYPTNGAVDVMALSIGLLLGLGLLGWLLVNMLQIAKGDAHDEKIGWNGFALACGMLALTMVYFSRGSLFQKFYLVRMQYPWRFLTFAGLFAAMTTAVLCNRLCARFGKKRLRAAIICILMLCIANVAPLCDMLTKNAGIICYGKNENYTHTADNLYWLENKPCYNMHSAALTVSDVVSISEYHSENKMLSFDFATGKSDEPTVIGVPRYVYPGYVAMLNGTTELTLAENEENCYDVQIPAGVQSGHITVEYVGEPFYRAGDCLSLITLVCCAGYGVLKTYRRKRKN